GRARGKRFVALSGQERIVYDSEQIDDEPERLRRKGGRDDDAA
ncbi:MAG: sulfurtransferase FdhD, partial [Pseudomonadota bacterium]|nr:sulfurtransferase FdhD [Pseudomonadota bacterium]